MPANRTVDLRALAERVAEALPPVVEEIVLTGSVSRGVADELSDIEMLLVTPEPLAPDVCFAHARSAGLASLDTWGAQGTPTCRVSGHRDGVPIELIWWPRDFAEASVDRLLAGDASAAADALGNGVALRTRAVWRAGRPGLAITRSSWWRGEQRRRPSRGAATRPPAS